MAVSTTDTYSGPYAANGVTVEFPFTFKAVSPGDVAVFLRDDLNGETLVDASEYTVSLSLVGGSVRFLVAPAVGNVFIASEPAFVQAVEFSSGQPFLPSVVNEVNDRDVTRALYLKDKVDRSFTAPLGERAGSMPPLLERTGMAAVFSPDGGLSAVPMFGGGPDIYDDGLWGADGEVFDDGEWGETAVRVSIPVDRSGLSGGVLLRPGEMLYDGPYARIGDGETPGGGIVLTPWSFGFPTREAFVANLAMISAVTRNGQTVRAGDETYMRQSGATAIADAPGWEAVNPSFAHFGGSVAGGVDVDASINACLSAYGECFIPEGEHQISAVTVGGRIHGLKGKSKLKAIGTGSPIRMWGTLGAFLNFNGTYTPGAKVVTVFGDITGLSPGDWIMTECDNPPIPNMAAQGTAEIVQIESIAGQVITLMQPLAFAYPTGKTRGIRLVNWLENASVDGVEIEGNLSIPTVGGSPEVPLIDFRFARGPSATNNRLHHNHYAAIQFCGCHAHSATGNYIYALSSADDDVNGGFGYGVHERGVNLGGRVVANTMEDTRTGYTTGAGLSSVYRYGVPMNTLVEANVMHSMRQSGCSSHEAGYYLSFIGNSINGTRSMGINVRAVGHIITSNTISNTIGAGVHLVASPNGDIRDTVVTNNTLIRTNQGTTPQGDDATVRGAVDSACPNPVITNNTIMYCGGPGIRVNGTVAGAVVGNTIVNPCQIAATNKFAIGGEVTGSGGHVVVANNHLLSNDGKVTNFIMKAIGFFYEGQGNTSFGLTGAVLAGEALGNYSLGGPGANRVNYGSRATLQLASDTMDLSAAAANAGLIAVNAETGGGGLDDLWTITGGLEGTELILRAATGNTITVKNGAGTSTNNVRTATGADLVLNSATKLCRFIKMGGLWVQTQ